jgi:alpha-ribazole phosphatase
MGDWEMQRYDEIVDDNLQRWYADYMNVRTTNGEGFPDLYARVSDFLNQLKTQPHRRVVVFAHGGVLICAGIHAGAFKRENAFEHLTPFGGLLKITI